MKTTYYVTKKPKTVWHLEHQTPATGFDDHINRWSAVCISHKFNQTLIESKTRKDCIAFINEWLAGECDCTNASLFERYGDIELLKKPN